MELHSIPILSHHYGKWEIQSEKKKSFLLKVSCGWFIALLMIMPYIQYRTIQDFINITFTNNSFCNNNNNTKTNIDAANRFIHNNNNKKYKRIKPRKRKKMKHQRTSFPSGACKDLSPIVLHQLPCTDHYMKFPHLLQMNYNDDDDDQHVRMNPDLPEWNMGCADYPDLARQQQDQRKQQQPQEYWKQQQQQLAMMMMNTDSTSSVSHPKLWPPLLFNDNGAEQGYWIEDPEYCHKYINTTQECFLNNKYRFQIMTDNHGNNTSTSRSDDISIANNKNHSSQARRNNTNTQQLFLLETYDFHKACNMLRERNISTVQLIGDSFIRHLFQGIIIILSNNINYDFVQKGKKKCLGDNAFTKKNCRINDNVILSLPVCHDDGTINRSILIQYHNSRTYFEPEPTKTNVQAEDVTTHGKTLRYYGVGNHPANYQRSNYSRLGILNTTAYIQRQWDKYSDTLFGQTDYFIWVPPHYKLSIIRYDSTNERAFKFLMESHNYFVNANNVTGTLNTYSMIQQATKFLGRLCNTKQVTNSATQCAYYNVETCQQATEITWDGVHVGRTLNQWKAQLALRYFELLIPIHQ